ncbi:hypothetical protein FQN49_008507 [Arthroderma sp. PD_2]|nr:hypothetical protein FQN49_008507 [Arthroderma sp. PD_2]
MGLNEYKAFSKDVLSIEICGPDRPPLTLVDLPGLIHSANKSQSDEDVELIRSLVENYISQKRTIILAVISAKNDYANQVILKNCRKFDPKGERTLGVITKPDYLRPNSENESAWIDLVKNRDIYFELGWHILKNRSDDEHQLSFTERNLREGVFFNAGSYKELPENIKGIGPLRERLSQLLFHHLKRELPILKEELDNMAKAVHMESQSFGTGRPMLADQRVYLADFFGSAYDIVVKGLDGNYEDGFFDGVDINAPVYEKENSRRLRALIQYLNIKFAESMFQRGHKYHVQRNDQEESDSEVLEAEPDSGEPQPKDPCQPENLKGPVDVALPKPQTLSRKVAIQRVVQILERSRGREIPGTFNPMLTSHLFREQSQGWDTIAHHHINRVAASCKAFLIQVLDHVAAPELKARILNLTVTPALKKAREAAFNELKKIEEDKRRHPITYNHYFTDTLQKLQQERYTFGVEKLAKAATVDVYEYLSSTKKYITKSYIDPETFYNKLRQGNLERDMDNFSAEQALETLDAFYKACI